ncbi:hypothetical protein [Streptomyces sp. SID3343]|uniref:hypothetical protein n=1 Tax=Streptomyces sp. SID3343 TaxID=2690260 RepID=UPI001369F6C9|nr:hypothetical protein [Streptomyces sp. SID3343]MYW05390.1 hypothetical protein [Streptomyces sp. SID3343]
MRPSTAKLLDRLILLAATILMAARQYHVPSKDFWERSADDTDYLPLVLICTIGVFGALTPCQALVKRSLTAARTATRNEILTHLGGVLKIATKGSSPIDIGDVALYIWRVRRSVRHPWHGRLERVAAYRLGNVQPTRSFAPPKGVGVVGLCWKENAEQKKNVERLAVRLATAGDFESHRNAHGEDAVMGLSWLDFTRVRHRGAVFATPIRNRAGNFVGCISVDARTGYDVLAVPEFWQEINSLSQTLGKRSLQNL